jgi:hypothetical protein
MLAAEISVVIAFHEDYLFAISSDLSALIYPSMSVRYLAGPATHFGQLTQGGSLDAAPSSPAAEHLLI